MATHYDIIFEGRTIPGKDIDAVKKALMQMLKIEDQRIDRLFTGQPVRIRRNADAGAAEKFRKAFEAAGAVCKIQEVEVAGGANRPQKEDPVEKTPAADAAPVRSVRTADGTEMIITNIETVPGKRITEHFGLVSGSTIRAKHVGRDLMAGLKNLVGGELKGYTQLLQESRKQALDRLVEQAKQLGANAIVNIRFSTSSVAQGAAELYAYGTAVRVT